MRLHSVTGRRMKECAICALSAATGLPTHTWWGTSKIIPERFICDFGGLLESNKRGLMPAEFALADFAAKCGEGLYLVCISAHALALRGAEW